jgi:hypothetical protein
LNLKFHYSSIISVAPFSDVCIGVFFDKKLLIERNNIADYLLIALDALHLVVILGTTGVVILGTTGLRISGIACKNCIGS